MSSNDIKYGEEYIELEEVLIPEMASILREYNDLLEKRFGYRLVEQLTNIDIQYNNSLIYIDHEFRKVGVDPNENLVREAIKSHMQEILFDGTTALEKSATLIGEGGSEEDVFKYLKKYNDSDEKLWKYDYKDKLVDHIMIYFLNSYFEIKKNLELESRKEGTNRKYSVDEILTSDMLSEVIDTLTKLGFPKEILLEAEEKWSEVLISLIKEKERKSNIKREKIGFEIGD